MKIVEMEVCNFRALESVRLPVHDYTTFVGPNGAGKSTFLYALDWFFGNRNLSVEDLTTGSSATEISVSVTFGGLSNRDTEKLGVFVNDNRASFRKSYNVETGRSLYTGLAKQGPGFGQVLAGTRVTEFRPAYKQLREKMDGLPDLGEQFSLDQVRSAFRDWVLDPANAESAVIEEQPADALFATPGSLDDICQFVLIHGSLDLATETHTTAKGSLLSVLTSSLIESARSHTIDRWRAKHGEAIDDLRRSTRDAVHTAIEVKTESINSGLGRYDGRAEVLLEATDPEVEVRYPTTITASIRKHDGRIQPINRQGHGLQRAVVMSMVEALHSDVVNSDDETAKTIILAAEEPEIYQHPVRARSFAQTLKKLAEQEEFQVILATHSSAFVSSDFMESLRFVRMHGGVSSAKHSSVQRLANIRGQHLERTREWLSKEVPRAFTDAFFADLAVIVEGETDEAVIPELANLLGTPLEQMGIVCFGAGSKNSVAPYRTILEEFGIPAFVVFDGDYCDDEPDATEDKKHSCRTQTSDCVRKLGLFDDWGAPRYSYGDPSAIYDSVAVLHKKLEHELAQWPSYEREAGAINKRNDKKNAYRYRRAVRSAAVEDMPVFLRNLIEQIIHRTTTSSIQGEPR